MLAPLGAQDTLRTYGPRMGVDLGRFIFYFSNPPERGAEIWADLEVYRNLYPTVELGFSTLSDSIDRSSYSMKGSYVRIGLDYNVLPLKNRSIHHSITAGLRYGTSLFSHSAEGITIPSVFWGDYYIDSYENSMNAHWLELVGGMKVEVLRNFFLGWTLRYKILLNPQLDPQIAPLRIPGYGNGTEDRAFGFTYTVSYKIPLMKK
jgi:hypothetical protein